MQLPAGTYNVSYAQDTAVVRTKTQWVLLIVFLIVLFSIPPLLFSGYWLSVLISIAIWIIAVHGLNILTGYCGVVSLGHAGFMAVGGYTAALLAADANFPFWAAIPCAGLGAAVVGMVFGLASLRIKGFYIAVATIAAHFIIVYLIKTFPDVTNGAMGMSVPPAMLGGIVIDTDKSFYFLAMGVAALMTFLALNVGRSKLGRAFVAIRDNDIAAEAMGVHLFRYKTIAFGIGCFYAGVAGALIAYQYQYVHTDMFSFMDSIWMLGTVVIGGVGSTVGPIFGVAFVQGLKQLAAQLSPYMGNVFPGLAVGITAALGPIIFGLILILFFVFEPRGIAHRWALLKNSYRLYPFSS